MTESLTSVRGKRERRKQNGIKSFSGPARLSSLRGVAFHPPEKYQETHCFGDGSLCLHLQWTPDVYIADTIVRWMSIERNDAAFDWRCRTRFGQSFALARGNHNPDEQNERG